MAKRPRKIPLRMCVGCQEKMNKRDLVRVVRSPDGDVSLDFTGKAAGRGAYICPRQECLEMAVKKRRLEKSLEQPLSESIIKELKERIEIHE